MKNYIPKLTLFNIVNENFKKAFDVLEHCKVKEVPTYNFKYPFFAPGGAYGAQWWQLDSALALAGYKWIDQDFAEKGVLNFVLAQKENGRIPLWGFDKLPIGENHSVQSDEVSSLPKIFDVAFSVIKRSKDMEFIRKTYDMMKKYLDWWFCYRQDNETKLISAVFEETFIPYLGIANEVAPIDTNMEVAVGCCCVAKTAELLGKNEEKQYYINKQKEIQNAVNKYLWNEEKGAYYAYNLKEHKQDDCLMASTFMGLRLNTVSGERKNRLLNLMTDDSKFNWSLYPLTTVSKDDPCFTTTKGFYQYNLSWSGNVWTLTNEGIIRALHDAGEDKYAAYLTLKTVEIFNNNFTEFANPFDATGHGILEYAWTASQYIELIIEQIFGIQFNSFENTVIIAPNLDESLKGEKMSIENIILPDGSAFSVFIDYSQEIKIKCIVLKNTGEEHIYEGITKIIF